MKPSAECKHIVFDLDGTLLDHESAAEAGVLAWLDEQVPEHGISSGSIVAQWKKLEDHFFSLYAKREMSFMDQRITRTRLMLEWAGVENPSAEQIRFENYQKHYEYSWHLFADAIPALANMKQQGLQLHIFTNGESKIQQRKCELMGLNSYMTSIISASDLSVSKPKAQAFTRAFSLLNVPISESVYVGDNIDIDIEGAASAGIKPVWIDRHHSGISTVHYTVNTLTDIETRSLL